MNLRPELHPRLQAAMPTLVAAVSLALFGAAAMWRAEDIRADAKDRIERINERLSTELARRLQLPIYGLNGARGVFAHSDRIGRAEFRAYVESRDLPREFPGVLGFSFNQRVIPSELDAFVKQTRADGAPGFTLRQLADKTQPDLYINKFIEPDASNAGALGLDIGSDPLRRRALQQAIDSGEPAMSAPITLLQNQRPTPSALLMVPIYARGTHPGTPSERRAAIRGLMVAPILLETMLRGMPEVASGLVDVELFDTTAGASTLIYDSDKHDDTLDKRGLAAPNHLFSTRNTLSVMGRDLTVRVNSEARFNAALDRHTPWLIALGGLLISALLWLYLRRRWQQHALVRALVDERSRELERERLRLKMILETATDGIYILDASGLLVQANPAMLRLLGRDESAIGQLRVTDWDTQIDSAIILQAISSLIQTQSASVFESRTQISDGSLIDVEISARGITIDGQGLVYCTSRDITARRQMTQTVAQQERDLLSVLNTMPAMIGYWDKNLRNRFGNSAYSTWFGVAPDQMPGKHIREVIGEDLYRQNLPYLEAALRGERQHFERIIPMPDGKSQRYSLAEYVPDLADGQVQGFYVMVSDISDIKRTTEALRHSEEKLRGLFELTPLGIAMADMSGRFIESNPAFQAICGYSEAELKAIDYWKLTPEKHMAGEAQQMEQLIASGRFGPYEKEYIRKDGSLVPVALNGIQVTDHSGQQFIWSIVEDISERKRTEQTLKENLATLRQRDEALSQISQGVMISGPDRLVTYVNDHAQRSTGYTREELLGKSCALLQGKDTDPNTVQQMRAALNRVQPFAGEILNYRRDGTPFWNELSITPVLDDAGQLQQFVGVQRDISQRKRAEEDLRQAKGAAEAANIAKSQFLASMSHEIRTPMNGIMGMAQVMRQPSLSEANRLDYADTIYRSGQTLMTLLNDILDLSKVEAGKLDLEAVALAPAQLIAEVQTLFAQAAQAKGLSIKAHWSGTEGRYLGDLNRLRQMLSNLVSNAIKFTPHGRICIEARELNRSGPSATLEFAVSDTGIGIDPDNQALLFQPFSQVDTSTTRQFGGTGLGLSLVHTLAVLMGGEVGVDSNPGVGSRFWFSVCVALSGANASESPTSEPPDRDVSGLALANPRNERVLLVEDNADHRRLTQILLRQLGMDVRETEDGEQGFDAIVQGEAASLILMDLSLPRLDGYAATEKIRQWERQNGQARRTILALTAYAYEEDRQRCLAAGMDEVLTKPLSLDALKAMLARWLPSVAPATASLAETHYQPIDVARVQKLVREIQPMLENIQFDSIERFKDLQQAVAGTSLAPLLVRAADAMQEYQFELALSELHSIMTDPAWQGDPIES